MMQAYAESILTAYLRVMNRVQFRLDPARATSLPGPQPGRQYMLYAHVPFCQSLCPYCSFNRFLFQEERARAYFQRLRQEMRSVAGLGYAFPSMYIGGGTPTILVDELCETIDLARSLFDLKEVSCETNPNHLTPDCLDRLKGRVQRLSVGVQSFDDDLLRQMGRYDSVGSGAQAFRQIQSALGYFSSLNVDMIFNFPNQAEDGLRRDLERVLACGANQTTFYPLMSAPSVERSLAQTVGRVTHRRESRYYHIIRDALEREFQLMAAWTFSRQGSRLIDEYIVDYEEYVGIGSGSFSYLDGSLYVNTFSLREYEQSIAAGHMSVSAMRRFSLGDRMRYRFLMELFGLKLDKPRFRRDFGRSIERGLWKEMAFMRLVGAFDQDDAQALTLTPHGCYLWVAMMREFFSGVNYIRDQARLALSPDERPCFMAVKKAGV